MRTCLAVAATVAVDTVALHAGLHEIADASLVRAQRLRHVLTQIDRA